MLLIWGWRARFKVLDGSGTFHCPKEGVDRLYERVEARRWFTLFWIPLIPLKVLGVFIRCTSCRSEYDERVLTLPTNAVMTDRLTAAIRHCVAAMAVADGHVDERERDVAVAVVNRFGAAGYTAADFDADVAASSTEAFERVIAEAGQVLSGHGQETLLRACLEMAHSDGHLDPREVATIQAAGRAMGMSPAHVRGVVAEAADREASA